MQMPDLSHIDISQLPHSLQALIDCIGIDNAYQLTCAYGGRPKYIPKHRERTKLADVLPPEALDALIKRFAGVALEIPKADHFMRQLRNLQIQKESAAFEALRPSTDLVGLEQAFKFATEEWRPGE